MRPNLQKPEAQAFYSGTRAPGPVDSGGSRKTPPMQSLPKCQGFEDRRPSSSCLGLGFIKNAFHSRSQSSKAMGALKRIGSFSTNRKLLHRFMGVGVVQRIPSKLCYCCFYSVKLCNCGDPRGVSAAFPKSPKQKTWAEKHQATIQSRNASPCYFPFNTPPWTER